MGMLRKLGLILIGLGLFVQTAAYASALPQYPVTVDRECNEMRMAGPQQDDGKSPCKSLRLDCLIAMGCIPPLAMADDVAVHFAHFSDLARFDDFAVLSLNNSELGPEPPPPELRA